MHLGPHHFQAQNQYCEDSAQFATSALWLAPWGLLGSQLDIDAIANGTVSLIHARGILSDGLIFNMPESDELPPPRNIAEVFPPTRDRLTVLLAVPKTKQDGLNCALTEAEISETPRYIAEEHALNDDNTGRDERGVRLGRKNIQLLMDVEPTGGFTVLPIARIMRSGSGKFVLDPHFIPPCLKISAADQIMSILQRLIEIMEEKSSSLAAPVSSTSGGRSAFSTREVASFWLLHTVNSSLAVLRHQFLAKYGHPEQLYLEMSRLGGALCTFAMDSHPRTLPAYDHEHLDECLSVLDKHIRDHLEMIIPTNCISIPLKRVEDYFYAGEVTDARCFGRSRWVFAIHAEMGRADLIASTPRLVKVCSQKYIQELVKRAVQGLGLSQLPVPPAAISARVETEYFEVDRTGACWNSILDTRRVGVYVPGDLPSPEIELLVILEN
jgi:type VI secretion system protein ImpJ